MKKYAIFDLDGTVLDSMPIWQDVGPDFLEKYSVPVPEGLNDKVKKMDFKEAMKYFIDTFALDLDLDEVFEATKEAVQKKYAQQVQLKPYTAEFLQKLKDNNVRMCVATASERSLCEFALKRLGVYDYFEFILTCSDVKKGKDDPYIFLKCVELFGCQPEDAFVVEDALYGMETAKKAGFFVVGVYDKSAEQDTVAIKNTADVYLNSFKDADVLFEN